MDRCFLTVAAPMEASTIIIALAAALGPATLSYAAQTEFRREGQAWLLISGLVGDDFAGALTSPETLRMALAPVVLLSEGEAAEVWGSIDASGDGEAAVVERLGFVLRGNEADS